MNQTLKFILSFTDGFDYLILIPALISSTLLGFLPPLMTLLIGQAFQSFTNHSTHQLNLNLNPSSSSSSTTYPLVQELGSIALHLLFIGLATASLSLFSHSIWSIYAARVCEKVQISIYDSISNQPLTCFENHHLIIHQHPSSTTSSTPAQWMARFSR